MKYSNYKRSKNLNDAETWLMLYRRYEAETHVLKAKILELEIENHILKHKVAFPEIDLASLKKE